MILFSPPTRAGTNSKGSRRCPGPAAVPLALLNFVEMLITLLPTHEKIGIGTAFATAYGSVSATRLRNCRATRFVPFAVWACRDVRL
jgi:hypothetical protein